MIKNSSGGFTFEISPSEQFERFLILGTEGGTFYASETKVTEQACAQAKAYIQAEPQAALDRIVEVSQRGRAARNEPAILALALVAAHAPAGVKAQVKDALPKVCRTGTHLLHFCQYVSSQRGWGRSVKRAVAYWYTSKTADRLAYQLVKYQSRDGWSHRDVLRCAHPVTDDPGQQAAFRWVVGGMAALGERVTEHPHTGKSRVMPSVRADLPKLIHGFEVLKGNPVPSKACKLIRDYGLTREMVPTQLLNEASVWEALLENMPLTATIRNLGKMSALDLLRPLSEASKCVVARLSSSEYIRNSRVHPIQILTAMRVYASGCGVKGDLRWSPVSSVLTALEKAFYMAFENVTPVNKPVVLALDVSASMGTKINGNVLRSCEITAAMALIWARTEPETEIYGFGDTFRPLGITGQMSLDEAMKRTVAANFGSTDISLAIKHARQKRWRLGGLVVMTDNEVNVGTHPHKEMADYRRRYSPEARLVVMATALNKFTVADPQDKLSMDVCGFSTAAPKLINDFIRGSAGPSGTPVEESDDPTE